MAGEPLAAEAERQMIGCVLGSAEALEDVLEVISPSDCADSRHEQVLDAAIALHRSGSTLDPLLVANRLPPEVLTRLGGTAGLLEVALAVVSPRSARHYAQIVRQAAMARSVGAVGNRLVQASMLHEELDDVETVVNAARAELDSLLRVESAEKGNAESVYEAIGALEEPPGLGTPWAELTRAVAGWRPANLYVMGARPSVGKSVLGTQAVLDVARRGLTGMLFSLEMSRVDLYHRMLSAVGSVNMHSIQHRSLSEREYGALARAAEHIAGLPLVVDDTPRITTARLEARVRAQQRRGKVGLVVVDYLQLLQPGQRSKDRRVDVDAIARDLQLAARELQVPILALAQLNRESARSSGGVNMPTLTDLRESGAIEQAADVVALLHREVDNPQTEGDLSVFLAKNRHGPTCGFHLVFQGWNSRALDADQARALRAG